MKDEERRLTIIKGIQSPPDRHEPRILYVGEQLEFKDIYKALKALKKPLRKDYYYTVFQVNLKKSKLEISAETVDSEDIESGAQGLFNRHVNRMQMYLDDNVRKALADLFRD